MLVVTMKNFFYIDMLSIIMIGLVSFVGIVVYCFSRRYMKGDSLYWKFFWNMLMLLLSVIIMAVADNLLLFLSAWCSCNWRLSQLIVHKSTWKAAKASSILAIKNFILGFASIALAFAFLYKSTGSFSIHYIVNNPNSSWYMFIALIMLLIGAMTQSAIWPFHRWLISSLNSPTPVSAIMHAGIVNGGGFLLIRFAPLYFSFPIMLNIIFCVGLISALLGSFWKLIQHDVKRMLACSTMSQMGFMLVQCGLGLFSSALAHLCWHGMFKAYLFLASGGAAQEKILGPGNTVSRTCFLLSLVCGFLGSYIFAIIHNNNVVPRDTTLIIVGIVFVACSQFALIILRGAALKRLPLAIILTAMMAGLYGVNIYFFDLMLDSLHLMQPQSLNILHISGLITLLLAWLSVLFVKRFNNRAELPFWVLNVYVKALNSSQPDPSTITTHRNGYSYE